MKNKLKISLALLVVTFYACSTYKSKPSVNDARRMTNVTSESFYNIITIKKDEMTFGVSETKPVDSDFYSNSNFFTNVKNGKAHVSAKKCPKRVDYASQTILWAIDNGVVNEYLLTQGHSKLERYRTILGEDKDGNIVMISSTRLGLVTIKEIIDFAVSKGITEAILLDGGTSVDYKLTDDDESVSFESVPEGLKPMFEIKKPTTYIYGNFN